MLRSMTGYGIASLENEAYSVTVEVKSVNSKTQDFSIKLPKNFQDKETEVKTLLGQILERGKVTVTIDFSIKGTTKPKIQINPEIFQAYVTQIKENAQKNDLSTHDVLALALGMPDVFDVDKSNGDTEKDWNVLLTVIKSAAEKCNLFREKEGESLARMLESYIGKIDSLLRKVYDNDPKRIEKIRERIMTKLNEWVPKDTIDHNRLEQELVYYIEKIDIEEEKVRLKSHLDYFLETMRHNEANGRKLGFIAQEIGREINTIGSKCSDAIIQKCVVEMKEELEKIKEQTLNIL